MDTPLIIVANDAAAQDEIMQMTLKMAVPEGAKLLIRTVEDAIKVCNDPRAKDKKIFMIVNKVSDAYAVASQVEDTQDVNVANVGRFDQSDPKDKVVPFHSVQLNPVELEAAKNLVKLTRVKSYHQVLPSNGQKDLAEGLKGL